jgi:argininosuccinate lyase
MKKNDIDILEGIKIKKDFKIWRHKFICSLFLSMFFGSLSFVLSAEEPTNSAVKDTDQEISPDWLQRIDKIHETGYNDWLTVAWAAMMVQQEGIISKEDAPEVARVLLDLLERPTYERLDGWTYIWDIDDYFMKELGDKVGGKLTLQRTTPPGRQTTYIRHYLLKRMCEIYEMQHAILELAEMHSATIMPGYTHNRHAQPMTFGHYLLSVYDAIQRSTQTLDLGYHMMNLNEMGVGAMAGTSWSVDRDLVTEYLGMDGLIENSNDAVSYTDGYLVVVSGLTNITNILSRMAIEFGFWSGTEYGFITSGAAGKSFFMPQKLDNPNTVEFLRFYASQMTGELVNIATAGLKIPHGDNQDMLRMEVPTKKALDLAEMVIGYGKREITTLIDGTGTVNMDRMLEATGMKYICATELTNQIVKDYDIGYRTAHDIVRKFVIISQEKDILPSEARAKLLDAAAEEVLGRPLKMTDSRVRELLSPENFIKVTDSQGGVATKEVMRMLDDRKEELEQFRIAQVQRIEKLEKAQEKLTSDLESLIN